MLYDWLKGDPQERGQLLNDWYKCLNHPKFDTSCMCNLKELNEMNVRITDAVMWAHKVCSIWVLAGKKTKKYGVAYYNSKVLQYLYTYAQHTDMVDNMVESMKLLDVFDLPTTCQWMYGLCFDYKDFDFVLKEFIGSHYYDGITLLLCTYLGVPVHMYYNNMLSLLCYMCTRTCAQNVFNSVNRDDIYQCLEDINKYAKRDKKFTSIKEIMHMHDGMVVNNNLNTVVKKNTEYVYHPLLLDIVNKHSSYWLPVSHHALFIRGVQHKNCVVSYADSHTRVGSPYSRIILSNYATVELVVYTYGGIIYSCSIKQHKGRFNKDQDMNTKLRDIMIELVGKSEEILCVKEVNNDHS